MSGQYYFRYHRHSGQEVVLGPFASAEAMIAESKRVPISEMGANPNKRSMASMPPPIGGDLRGVSAWPVVPRPILVRTPGGDVTTPKEFIDDKNTPQPATMLDVILGRS